MDDKHDIVISSIQSAITDSQETIRAYDSKAEILALMVTLAVGVTNYSLLTNGASVALKNIILVSWIVAILAIGFLGMVIVPRKNLFKDIQMGSYEPQGTYFLVNLTSSSQNTVKNLSEKALSTDWVYELMYENMKLSVIRDYKHKWFKCALYVVAFDLLIILLGILVYMCNG